MSAVTSSHERQAKRNNTRASSEAVRKAVERRTLRSPVVIQGIGPGRLTTITPNQFKRLDVDPAYQRGQTSEVGKIVRALQAGGKVLDPCTLCVRNSDPDSKMWIVDGYQRVCAHQQLGLPFQAMVHESDGQDAERTLFIAMNERKQVSANVTVKAWEGQSGEMLRKAHDDPTHPLFGRLNFGQESNKHRISAASLARSLLAVCGIAGTATTTYILSRVDTAIRDREERVRAEHFLRLVGLVWPKGTPKLIVLSALAKVARERWEDGIAMPGEKVIARLENVQWDVPLVEKYKTLIVERLSKVWKA